MITKSYSTHVSLVLPVSCMYQKDSKHRKLFYITYTVKVVEGVIFIFIHSFIYMYITVKYYLLSELQIDR